MTINLKIAKLFLLSIAIVSCENKYSVEIISMDPITRYESSDTIHFSSSDDTTAFKHAVTSYWSKKTAIKKTNKQFEQKLPEPFFFILNDDNDSPIRFSADIAEQLSAPTIKYFKDSVLPKIDTITPFSKQPKERTANIY